MTNCGINLHREIVGQLMRKVLVIIVTCSWLDSHKISLIVPHSGYKYDSTVVLKIETCQPVLRLKINPLDHWYYGIYFE